MFSAMLLAIAVVALFQFALYYWHAVLTGVAMQPVSEYVLEAARVAVPELRGSDFEKLASLHTLTPELKTSHSSLSLVRFYYEVVRKAEQLFGRFSPAALHWGECERALCARYAAVQIDRRLQANLAQAASIRSSC
jgi:hypothetical protein